MLKNRIIEIMTLIFIMAALACGALVFNHYKFEKPNTYDIIFKDIDSIVKGSPVRFMGINVGYVLKLKRKDGYIICKIRITKNGVKIPNATRAKVAFNGLGGSKSIELMPPSTDDANLSGIIADDSLRINDFGGMMRALTEVSVFINRFVHELDADALVETIKEYTNKDALLEADKSIENASIKQKNIMENAKNAAKKENSFSNLIDFVNGKILIFFHK